MQYMGFGLSDRGQRRAKNEDVTITDAKLGLWVVCDGMGGHAKGDLAAQTAAQTVHKFLSARQATLTRSAGLPTQREEVADLMRQAVVEASGAVFELVRSGRGAPGMGTTLTALLTLDHLGVMAHVGDSRLYLCRSGAVHQLSDDHTIAAELVKRGGVSQATVEELPIGKALSRAVGIQPSVEVDSLVLDVLPDDTFLLCSDGLTRYLNGPQDLAPYLGAAEPQHVPAQLVSMANQRGGRDNISAVVVRAHPTKHREAAEQARKTEVITRLQALGHVSLFQHLTLKELVQVMNRTTEQRFERGAPIIRQGDPGDGLYVILDGSVSVTRGGSELAVLAAGEHFGEMALLSARPRSATVTARQPTRIIKMDRDAFHAIMHYHANLAVKLLWTFSQVLSARLDEASENIFNVAPTRRVPPEVADEIRAAAEAQIARGRRWSRG